MNLKRRIQVVILSAATGAISLALVSQRAAGQADIVPGKKKTPSAGSKPTPKPAPKATPAPTPKAPPLLSYEFEVVTLDANSRVTERRQRQARYYVETLGGRVTLEMVEIPEGTFRMGLGGTPVEGEPVYAKPMHQVKVPAFYLGKYEVTQAQWREVASWPKVNLELNPAPSYFKGDNRPVERVSWEEAMEFCARLSQKTGRTYRLPSEAEWEYACRAGTTTRFHFGESITPEFANFNPDQSAESGGAPRGQTRPVGSPGGANAFGLYDMHGNVYEWCSDAWHENYDGAPADGSAWENGGDPSKRVVRGGSWRTVARPCRSGARNWALQKNKNATAIGFRVAVAGAPTR